MSTTNANAAPFSTLAGDMESQANNVQVNDEVEYEYVDGVPERIEERIVKEDGTVVIKVTMKTKRMKRIKKKATTPPAATTTTSTVTSTPVTSTTTTSNTVTSIPVTSNTVTSNNAVTSNVTSSPVASTTATSNTVSYDNVASPKAATANYTAVATTPKSDPVKIVSIAVDVNDATCELPTGVITTGKWESSLFSCFDHCVPNCLMATCCPCVSAAQIASRIGYSYWTVLAIFAVAIGIEYIFWGAAGAVRFLSLISTVVAIGVFIAFWQLRSQVRAKFEIPGSPLEDCLISWCCSCCSLAQMATHVKSYKKGSCDFGPPDELHAYAY